LLRLWSSGIPVAAVLAVAVTWGRHLGAVSVMVLAVVLAGAVLTAVHHAEVIAHKFGQPPGALVLAGAVTVIEVALIVGLMGSGGPGTASLARDTVFAAVMITSNGVVGLSLLVGAVRFGVAVFNPEGTGSALAAVVALSTLSLVLPTFTSSRPGPQFSPPQLTFAAVASLLLYALFVLTQTVRHRELFLPITHDGRIVDPQDQAESPTRAATAASMVLLVLALGGVVGLAKVESPAIAVAVSAAGFPGSFVGVVIALLVLLPETLAAVRSSARNHIQISLNLAYGSAIASIGLTVPAVALASIWLRGPLLLGLEPSQIVLLAVTVVAGILTVLPGRATRLQGEIHLLLFAAFLVLSIYP
jgi:Ca2+:H+ antiporter